MASDRVNHHLLAMIDTMLREGRDEAEITRALEDAQRQDTADVPSKAA